MKPPVNVAITGAAGQIGYALAFRVASGAMLGADQPINLHLLEITPALPTLGGVVMELNDCAFPTLNRMVATDDPRVAFRDCQVAMLVGARPRGPGMERKDLLLANAQIFSAQGKALNEVADRKLRVLVVGNPANTNALIASQQRARSRPAQLHRHDAAGSQPRSERSWPRRPAHTSTTSAGSRSGAIIPRPSIRTSVMRPCRASRRGIWSTRSGSRAASFRPCSSAAPRSSRRAAPHRPRRPPRRQSITCAPGCSARAAGTGPAWPCRPTAATACRTASSIRIRSPVPAANTRSCRAWASMSSAASA